ncbi:hypothetical protein FRC10_003858 [Ceratobasidium sp. 414]|nr:hypothetical protein FRC10_003858 [Ceratobasidium sp. 414]
MLSSAAIFSLAIAAAASALTITAPDSNGWKNGTVTVSWTSTSGDPDVFSVELRDTNTPSVISPLAVGMYQFFRNRGMPTYGYNRCSPQRQHVCGDLFLPASHRPGWVSGAIRYSSPPPPPGQLPTSTTYQLEFVNVTNINQAYATSVTFPIVNQAQSTTSPGANSDAMTSPSPSTLLSATSAAPASTTSAAPNTALALNIPAVAPMFFACLAALL